MATPTKASEGLSAPDINIIPSTPLATSPNVVTQQEEEEEKEEQKKEKEAEDKKVSVNISPLMAILIKVVGCNYKVSARFREFATRGQRMK